MLKLYDYETGRQINNSYRIDKFSVDSNLSSATPIDTRMGLGQLGGTLVQSELILEACPLFLIMKSENLKGVPLGAPETISNGRPANGAIGWETATSFRPGSSFPNGSPYPSLYPRPPSVTWLKRNLVDLPSVGCRMEQARREEGEEGGGSPSHPGGCH